MNKAPYPSWFIKELDPSHMDDIRHLILLPNFKMKPNHQASPLRRSPLS